MATLTVKCKNGDATIETGPDDTAEQIATRLRAEIQARGGQVIPRADRRRAAKMQRLRPPPTPDEQRSRFLQEIGKLECRACKTWIPATQAAADRHSANCTAARQPN